MQNKSAIWIFTILLALACLYSLSFSFFTSSFEDKADAYAQDTLTMVMEASGETLTAEKKEAILEQGRSAYTTRHGNEELIPLVGYDYYDCRSRELQKGLDLEGGMSVTLEVSVSELITKLSGGNKSEAFEAAKNKAIAMQGTTSGKTFIELFEDAWTSDNEPGKLAKIFHSYQNKERFPADATDEEIIQILKDESEAAVANTEKIIRTRVDQFGVTQPTIQRQQFTDRILVELPGAKDKEQVRKLLKSTANLEFWEVFAFEELATSLQAINDRMGKHLNPELFVESVKDTSTVVGDDGNIIDDAVDQIVDATKDSTELADGVTDINDLDDESTSPADEPNIEEERLKNPLFAVFAPSQQPGAILGFTKNKKEVMEILTNDVVKDLIPAGDKLTWSWGKKSEAGFYALYALKTTTSDGFPRLDGESIVSARQDFDQFSGQALVSMDMNSEGSKIWASMTREASSATPKQCIAVVMDGVVHTAPVVNTEITRGSSQITMGGQDVDDAIKEAADLANLLEAGALPTTADIVDEQIVGSSIGPENASKGLWSFAIALLVILVYMVFYYSGAGGISDIALLANMFFLTGALVSLKASLTLPGIAGIILTIGMAVDANVLIFERIKEELRAGAGKQAAINKGYKKAYSAILDANITTFLTGLVLFLLGSGPIKGFATTLMIGIVTSLFSAIFITRLIISWRMESKKDVAFYTSMTKNLFANNNFDFIGKRKIFYGISSVIVIAGIASLFTNKLDLGVDFTGGRTFDIEFVEQVSSSQVEEALANAFVDDNGIKSAPSVKSIGTAGNKVRITTNFLVNDNRDDVDEIIEGALTKNLASVGTVQMDKFQSKKVDSTISDDFQDSSMLAIGFSLLIIFLYILIRFRKKEFGFGALVAMAHDVLVVLGIFSIFWKILPFSMEIDQAFIAAILTVVGYSINDTVVVFDRLREYLNERKRGVDKAVVNSALNSTLSRTVNTSMSTFIVLLMIFLFGGDSIKGFTFALMIGVVVGTYSSLCIATPLVVDLSKKEKEI